MTAAAPGRPTTFDEAIQGMTATPEEEALLDAPPAPGGAPSALEARTEVELPDPNAIPDWVEFPPGLKIPPGKELAFVRLKARWTDAPQKGDRSLILWPLSVNDEKLALQRTRGEQIRTLPELAKQTIRAVDGKRAGWGGEPESTHYPVERLWEEIGPKCRPMIINHHLKTHALDDEEQADFFLNCVVVRSSVAG